MAHLEDPIVTTETGDVRGRWRSRADARGTESVHATFRGIPFAAPPVGSLRFAAPAPVAAWDGERDAGEFGPTPQRESPYDPPRIPEPSIPGEDVLSVNVTTPDPSRGAGLPVLVWIHGGGFIAGSAASPWYVGESFARDGVVTATLSYRLGFEGFGCLEDAVPNRGVLDWIAGLEWIQRNIAAFGGDPERVTIAGQSAGGAAVMRLLTLPSAQHLFARALAISPADASVSRERAREAARAVAQSLGVSTNVAGMSSVDEIALFRALNAAVPAAEDPLEGLLHRSAQPLPFAPVVDGDVVPHGVTEGVIAGVGADKPVLIGATAHEFNESLAGATASMPQPDAARLLRHAGAPEGLAETMAAREPQRGTDWALGQAVSDGIFRAPVAGWAALRGSGPTWAYDFRWESRSDTVSGAAHCVDVPFGFDILGRDGVAQAVGDDPPQALADAVHADWLALVRDGAVDAPPHMPEHATITYGADGLRRVAPGYEVERRVWTEGLGRPLGS
ncbi:carboxylesterase/lipase family protein [Demequina activiva]|uniref:Carboxylic ester hydrolase n=1 Tax=Demequina activiva TaxID=1582364 RepID=A0A919ULR6_9MICO|nr:carboxylesterase family protein [Demequina activiva]GIG54973.1 carboxylic ester hydrolase [Demequina activiva]